MLWGGRRVGLLAGGAFDLLAEEVGVADVAGVFRADPPAGDAGVRNAADGGGRGAGNHRDELR